MSRLLLGFSLLLLFSAVIPGLLEGEPVKDPVVERIARLIDQLGDDDFDQREAASKGLSAIGEKTLPALRAAAVASNDAEIRRRAHELIPVIITAARISTSTGLELTLVEAGEFDMGSPRNESNRRPDELQHRVQITRPFLLGVYEVTQAEYRKVTKTNPSYFSAKGPGKDQVGDRETDRFPVEQVTWYDTIDFCNRLSQMDGYEPYYKIADVKRNGDNIVSATVTVAGGNGYRLPTEAEWEYGCRAGSRGRFFYGSNSGKEANLKPGPSTGVYGITPSWPTLNRTAKVGSYKPNDWGFHDMHGNASEWCWDWYDADYYANSPAADPTGPRGGEHRVIRSGSWLVSDINCRSASRGFHKPDEKPYYAGFRIARTP